MKHLFPRSALMLLLLLGAMAAHADDARVYFQSLADGASVTSPVHAQFGVDGMTVAPAGSTDPNTGHFHVIIDAPAVAAGEVIPFDAQHLHYGKGQTEADIPLPPGEHTLTLQFADGAHRAYGGSLDQTIHVTVR
ncbi:MAG: DUF4399 domain-containing protein [Paludibacterium sp.]|uniref:DUF4399 domain-containing protein n=1 Tax=Paludibacterium sp. TaxID=1917523 RepID=UPI0025F21F39|nr:DUF4399 domain-containing protein [Paludibacterium sp.]MBV8048070.1 DUF4399 domain-containing protein [Paludibacterium sp.]MBV8646953.1 DUF4399 domain-containing protein [Paludibacterium sp.]